MMQDDQYKNALELLEKNRVTVGESDIPSVHPSLKDICSAAAARLRAASVPYEYERCADVFGMYWHRVRECAADKEADSRIVKACGALADALRDSGKSGYFTLLDQEIWREAVGPEDLQAYQDKTTNGEWLFAGKPTLSLEPYLRAMIKCIEYNAEMLPNHHRWMGDVLPKSRSSKKLRPFVIRAVRESVDLVATQEERRSRSEESWHSPMPDEWCPRPQIDATDPRTPYGRNEITARLASILLAQEITGNDVSKTLL